MRRRQFIAGLGAEAWAVVDLARTFGIDHAVLLGNPKCPIAISARITDKNIGHATVLAVVRPLAAIMARDDPRRSCGAQGPPGLLTRSF